jgi:CO/xanthine dehydrogenase Mo-binding subunit
MDYAMPRADNFCNVVIEDNPVPTPTNPLGVKGAGEAGTVGSLSAGVNAIVDALSVLGIRHIDTQCTPYRVWRAIANVGASVTKHSSSKGPAISATALIFVAEDEVCSTMAARTCTRKMRCGAGRPSSRRRGGDAWRVRASVGRG